MNKYLKYILVFITVFLSIFIKDVDAADKNIIKTCTYNNTYTFHLYDDGSAAITNKKNNSSERYSMIGHFGASCPDNIYTGTISRKGDTYLYFGPDKESCEQYINNLGEDKECQSIPKTGESNGDDPGEGSGGGSGTGGGVPDDDVSTCYDVLGSEVVKKIQKYFNYIKIVVPIIILIFAVLDFGNAVLNSDGDQLKKSQVKLAKRLIVAVIIFLLPTFITFILRLVGNTSGTCGVR